MLLFKGNSTMAIQPCYDGQALSGIQGLAGDGLSLLSIKEAHKECKLTKDPHSRETIPSCSQGLKARNSFINLHKPDLRRIKGLESATLESIAELFEAHNAESSIFRTYKRKMTRFFGALVPSRSKTLDPPEILIRKLSWNINTCVLSSICKEEEIKKSRMKVTENQPSIKELLKEEEMVTKDSLGSCLSTTSKVGEKSSTSDSDLKKDAILVTFPPSNMHENISHDFIHVNELPDASKGDSSTKTSQPLHNTHIRLGYDSSCDATTSFQVMSSSIVLENKPSLYQISIPSNAEFYDKINIFKEKYVITKEDKNKESLHCVNSQDKCFEDNVVAETHNLIKVESDLEMTEKSSTHVDKFKIQDKESMDCVNIENIRFKDNMVTVTHNTKKVESDLEVTEKSSAQADKGTLQNKESLDTVNREDKHIEDNTITVTYDIEKVESDLEVTKKSTTQVVESIFSDIFQEMQEIDNVISSYISSFYVLEEEYNNYPALHKSSKEVVSHFIEQRHGPHKNRKPELYDNLDKCGTSRSKNECLMAPGLEEQCNIIKGSELLEREGNEPLDRNVNVSIHVVNTNTHVVDGDNYSKEGVSANNDSKGYCFWEEDLLSGDDVSTFNYPKETISESHITKRNTDLLPLNFIEKMWEEFRTNVETHAIFLDLVNKNEVKKSMDTETPFPSYGHWATMYDQNILAEAETIVNTLDNLFMGGCFSANEGQRSFLPCTIVELVDDYEVPWGPEYQDSANENKNLSEETFDPMKHQLAQPVTSEDKVDHIADEGNMTLEMNEINDSPQVLNTQQIYHCVTLESVLNQQATIYKINSDKKEDNNSFRFQEIKFHEISNHESADFTTLDTGVPKTCMVNNNISVDGNKSEENTMLSMKNKAYTKENISDEKIYHKIILEPTLHQREIINQTDNQCSSEDEWPPYQQTKIEYIDEGDLYFSKQNTLSSINENWFNDENTNFNMYDHVANPGSDNKNDKLGVFNNQHIYYEVILEPILCPRITINVMNNLVEIKDNCYDYENVGFEKINYQENVGVSKQNTIASKTYSVDDNWNISDQLLVKPNEFTVTILDGQPDYAYFISQLPNEHVLQSSADKKLLVEEISDLNDPGIKQPQFQEMKNVLIGNQESSTIPPDHQEIKCEVVQQKSSIFKTVSGTCLISAYESHTNIKEDNSVKNNIINCHSNNNNNEQYHNEIKLESGFYEEKLVISCKTDYTKIPGNNLSDFKNIKMEPVINQEMNENDLTSARAVFEETPQQSENLSDPNPAFIFSSPNMKLNLTKPM